MHAISIIKLWRSEYGLILINPIIVRGNIYIETAPWILDHYYAGHTKDDFKHICNQYARKQDVYRIVCVGCCWDIIGHFLKKSFFSDVIIYWDIIPYVHVLHPTVNIASLIALIARVTRIHLGKFIAWLGITEYVTRPGCWVSLTCISFNMQAMHMLVMIICLYCLPVMCVMDKCSAGGQHEATHIFIICMAFLRW